MKLRLGWVLPLFAVLALAATAVMMFGARFGLWPPIYGFGLVRTYLVPMGCIVLAISILGFAYLMITGRKGSAIGAGIAALIGVALLFPTIQAKLSGPKSYAMIHDITTDTDNPPAFQVLDESREGANNSLNYAGDEVARIQKDSYPQIGPQISDLSADQAFQKALMTAKDMGWTIVDQDADARRFEATAYTPVFHFADDIVVVVTATDDTSRVDMRSVSRVGRSDMGANAARIEAFQKAFAN